MKILFYRYGNICEPDVIESFKKLNIEVVEETTEITNKKLLASERIQLLEKLLQKHTFLFVFSINYYPSIAEYCHIMQLTYVCWTVDSPVLELFSKSISYSTNRIFMFDRTQYEYFHPQNPDGIFYLPLGTNVSHWDEVLLDNPLSQKDIDGFSGDVSFVGSLYYEKSPLEHIKSLPDYVNGFIDGLLEAQLPVYGYNFLEEALPADIVAAIKKADPNFYQPADAFTNPDSYIAAHFYLGMKLAALERTRTLALLSKLFSVDVYTRSDLGQLPDIHAKGGIKTLTEMPKVFHLSKINLNMTMRPIQSGLSLRVFDVMGCGGFLMTNYQSELPDYFESGKDLETYSSMAELVEKVDYYLKHDSQREQIARNGYEKTKKYHTYDNRIAQMIQTLHDWRKI